MYYIYIYIYIYILILVKNSCEHIKMMDSVQF